MMYMSWVYPSIKKIIYTLDVEYFILLSTLTLEGYCYSIPCIQWAQLRCTLLRTLRAWPWLTHCCSIWKTRFLAVVTLGIKIMFIDFVVSFFKLFITYKKMLSKKSVGFIWRLSQKYSKLPIIHERFTLFEDYPQCTWLSIVTHQKWWEIFLSNTRINYNTYVNMRNQTLPAVRWGYWLG